MTSETFSNPLEYQRKMNHKLKPKEVNEGQELAIQNAKALYNSAKILFENKCYCHAYSLLIMAQEEISKVIIIPVLANENPSSRTVFWKQFYDHRGKLTYLISTISVIQELLNKGLSSEPDKLADLDLVSAKSYARAMEISKKMDQDKKGGFYLDYREQRFMLPESTIGKREIKMVDEGLKIFPSFLSFAQDYIGIKDHGIPK